MLKYLKRGPGFYGYLWRLTGPIALQNLITFSLGLIDTLMVSWLGNTQMAAVTTANVPVFLLISIVFGVQSGLGILVSQYWGKKDMESISRAIGVAAMLGTGITLVLAVVLFLWPVQIMDLLSNKHELSVLGAPYLKLIGFSYVFNMLSSIYVSAMRSAENSGFGMKLFGVSTLLNTGMNYILIFGKCGFPALGIQGAAIATLLSRVAEFLICLVCALRSRILPLDLAAFFRPGWEMLRRFVKYSTPVILNETAWGLGNSLLTVVLGHMTISVEFLAANAVMGNLNRLLANRSQPAEVQAQSIEGLHSWIESIRSFPKPVVAAVEGAAAGAGFSLALACDFIVAAHDAVFVMAYSSVALSPDGGGSWSLAQQLPRQLATELLMCGEKVAAQRLLELGVLNRLAPPGNALAEALALAHKLNQRAPNALASIKELLNDAATNALHQQLASERDHFVRNLHHANAGTGIAALLAKQTPTYE